MCDPNSSWNPGMNPSRRTMNVIVTAAIVSFAVPCAAEDFLRGDLNSDGVVSWADFVFFSDWLIGSGPGPECESTADVNDDATIDSSDAGALAPTFYGEKPSPAAPYPKPGPDPTPNVDAGPSCTTYGQRPIAADETAELRILEVSAPGGRNDRVQIQIALTNATEVAGLRGRISFGGGIVRPARRTQSSLGTLTDLSGTLDSGLGNVVAEIRGGEIAFGMLPNADRSERRHIPAGSSVPVIALEFCLEQGTLAGDYELEIREAELIDAETGTAIFPARVGATMTVEQDLSSSAGCDPGDGCVEPDFVAATFELADAAAAAGTSFTVPLTIQSTAVVQVFGFVIDFDESVLQIESLETLDLRPDPHNNASNSTYHFDNDDDVPGGDGVDEGWAGGFVAYLFPEFQPRPGERAHVADVRFSVRPGVSPQSTEIRFSPESVPFFRPGRPDYILSNHFHACGLGDMEPETADSFVFVSGLVEIIDQVSIFVRGDADGNRRLEITDAQRTLDYLFATSSLDCPDAADSNDDGRLDVSDPIHTLQFLFLGGRAPPPPYPNPQGDPTKGDTLGCAWPES